MNMKKRIIALLIAGLFARAAFTQEAPLWLLRRGAVYPPDRYVTGVGEGGSAVEAREKALAGAETTRVSQNTVINSEAEFFGVEFAETFTDSRGLVHALAFIDQEEAGRVYEGRIQANALLIGDLIRRYENTGHPKEAVRRLREARRFAAIIVEYADMAILLNSDTASRYDELPAIASRIDGMIEANEKRFTATISLNDEEAAPVALKAAEILRRGGFLLADSGGVYTVFINFRANENTTRNYYTLEPVLEIVIEAQDGTPLVTYTKKYPLFRHVTREEALARALRNIEQDLTGEFTNAVRRIGE
jgi:hypothetical protein